MSKFENKKAPAFSLENQNGELKTMDNYKGENIILYFYPKDNTPGCTVESISFNDNLAKLKKAGVTVVGVSKDNAKSHCRFIEKFGFKFDILVDEEKELIGAYDLLKEKSMFGKKYIGVDRQSFLINKEGVVVKHYEKVKPADHVAEVLKDAKELL